MLFSATFASFQSEISRFFSCCYFLFASDDDKTGFSSSDVIVIMYCSAVEQVEKEKHFSMQTFHRLYNDLQGAIFYP
jgi:hypothetical protein